MRQAQADRYGVDREFISVDTPVYFSFQEFIEQIRDKDRKTLGQNSKKTSGEYGNLIVRMESRLRDPKYAFLGLNKRDEEFGLRDLFEHFFGVQGDTQMTVLDLSGLASDVRSVIIGVVCRLVFEYKYWDLDPHDLPLLLVLEEAHNYLPRTSAARYQTSTDSLERIAKEGRKYGLSLFIVSQRPSELNETVLSQCSSFIALRLTNPTDQEYVRKLLPDFLAVAVDALPYLRTGEAVIAGEAVILPTRVQITEPKPAPRSDDVSYLKAWKTGLPEDYQIAAVLKRWRTRQR